MAAVRLGETLGDELGEDALELAVDGSTDERLELCLPFVDGGGDELGERGGHAGIMARRGPVVARTSPERLTERCGLELDDGP